MNKYLKTKSSGKKKSRPGNSKRRNITSYDMNASKTQDVSQDGVRGSHRDTAINNMHDIMQLLSSDKNLTNQRDDLRVSILYLLSLKLCRKGWEIWRKRLTLTHPEVKK